MASNTNPDPGTHTYSTCTQPPRIALHRNRRRTTPRPSQTTFASRSHERHPGPGERRLSEVVLVYSTCTGGLEITSGAVGSSELDAVRALVRIGRCCSPVIPSHFHIVLLDHLACSFSAAQPSEGQGADSRSAAPHTRSVGLVRAREPSTEMKFISGGRTQAGANPGRKSISAYG